MTEGQARKTEHMPLRLYAVDARGDTPLTDGLLIYFRAFVAERGWSLRKLGRLADLAFSTLADFYKEGWSPTLQTLRKIEAAIIKAERNPVYGPDQDD